jgi:hypothetical protein
MGIAVAADLGTLNAPEPLAAQRELSVFNSAKSRWMIGCGVGRELARQAARPTMSASLVEQSWEYDRK